MKKVLNQFKLVTALILLMLCLNVPNAVCLQPSRQVYEQVTKAKNSADSLGCAATFQQAFEISDGRLYVNIGPGSGSKSGLGCKQAIKKDSIHIEKNNYSVNGELVIFQGPVRTTPGGILINGSKATDGLTGRGWAVFYSPVSINSGRLETKGGGQVLFYDKVDISHGGIYLTDWRDGPASLAFHGPVSIESGGILLSGDNSILITGDVKIKQGAFHLGRVNDRDIVLPPDLVNAIKQVNTHLARVKDQASLILGEQATLTVGTMEIVAGNKLIFSLSASRSTVAFINVDSSITLDVDCLVIDNPDDVLEEGVEFVLIAGEEIKVTGDNRKIVSNRGDEFELLVGEKQISVRLTKLSINAWYDSLKFHF